MARTALELPIFSGSLLSTSFPFPSPVIRNLGYSGLIVNVHISAVNVAGTLNLKLGAYDANDHRYDVPGAAFPAITGTGDYQLYISPFLAPVPGSRVQAHLPIRLYMDGSMTALGDFTTDVSWTLTDT